MPLSAETDDCTSDPYSISILEKHSSQYYDTELINISYSHHLFTGIKKKKKFKTNVLFSDISDVVDISLHHL